MHRIPLTTARGTARTALITALAILACTGAAVAASQGTVKVRLTPDTPNSRSTLDISATGPFTSTSGLPKSVEILVQKGFRSSSKSVAVLCSASQASSNNCPAKSQTGSGTAMATATAGATNYQDTITLKLFLGVPEHTGDIASVVIVGTDSVLHQTQHATGRLFVAHGGSLELLFSQLPKFQIPPGVSVKLDSLSMTSHAVRTVVTGTGKHKHRVSYSLITNPPTCTGGHWSSHLTVTFASGSVSRAVSSVCRSH